MAKTEPSTITLPRNNAKIPKRELLVCFYGDDFTGSTDALEVLSQAGIRTALFTRPPSPMQVVEYPALEALGVAGMTRSMNPEAMGKVLRPALCELKALKPRHVHYKVCSTFDSSPSVGSVGKVMDEAWEIFNPRFIPLLVGAPALGRHCVFGNLFARAGKEGEPLRLDRHPTMTRHPITPAEESDLRLHLARQTKKRIGLFDILKVALPHARRQAALEKVLRDGAEVVLFDVLYEHQLAVIGELIDSFSDGKSPLFSVGSSGIEGALVEHWKREGRVGARKTWPDPGRADPLLVVSGSCSPVTENQIRFALRNGFAEVALDTAGIAGRKSAGSVEEKAVETTVRFLRAGRSVIVHSSRGPEDLRIEETRKILSSSSLKEKKGHRRNARTTEAFSAEVLGSAIGRIVRGTLGRIRLRRVCIAGGDTSGYAAQALGVESMEMIGMMAPGAPLCRIRARGSPADGLEMNFKGGQVGSPEYFCRLMEGQCD